jgi:hypothetical protein
LLWRDKWHGAPLQGQFPHLYSFSKDDNTSVIKVLNLEDLAEHFNLPLSEEAYSEFLHLQLLLESLTGSHLPDRWSAFGSTSHFKVSNAYKSLMGNHISCPSLKWVWKSCCQSKHKVFCWLLIHNRLNSRQLMQRKGFFLTDLSLFNV